MYYVTSSDTLLLEFLSLIINPVDGTEFLTPRLLFTTLIVF